MEGAATAAIRSRNSTLILTLNAELIRALKRGRNRQIDKNSQRRRRMQFQTSVYQDPLLNHLRTCYARSVRQF